MNWLLLVIATVGAVELLFRLSVLQKAAMLTQIAGKAAKTINAPKVSDHWKEQAIPAYAGRMMATSVQFFVLLIVVVSPFALLSFIPFGASAPFAEFILSLPGIIGSIVIAGAYVVLRKRVMNV